jgi:hypothetical protein
MPDDSKVMQALNSRIEGLIKGRHPLMVLHKGGEGKAYPPYPFLLELPFLLGFDKADAEKEKGAIYGFMDVEQDGKKHRFWGLFSKGENGTWHRKVVKVKAPAKSHAEFLFPENCYSPLLNVTIELPLFLATEDLLDMVIDQIRYYRDGLARYHPHPLSQLVNAAKVKARDKTLADCVRAVITGNFDATTALRAYYFDQEIQRQLQERVNACRSQHERLLADKKFRKLIRDRFDKALRMEWAKANGDLPFPTIHRRWSTK